MRYELTDYEWTAIKPMLPNKPRGVPRVNDRRVLNGKQVVYGPKFCGRSRHGAPERNTQKIALAGAHDVNGPLTVFCFE